LSDLDHHSLDFRRRALDLLGSGHPFGEVARMFGISEDLLFSWVRDGVADGTVHPQATSGTGQAAGSIRPSANGKGSPSDPGSIFKTSSLNPSRLLLIALFVGVFAVLIPSLWVTGDLSVSREYWRASRLDWAAFAVVIGLGLYPLFRGGGMSKAAAKANTSATSAVFACSIAALALGAIYAFLAPNFMHWIERKPVQVQTSVLRRALHDGRGCRWYLDTTISSGYTTILLCVDKRTYDQAHFGQGIRIDGLQSWYGLEVESYTIVDR
jgi:hypothetical protein